MKITIPNIIISALNTNDIKYVDNKLRDIESQLLLNEVEKRIIHDIDENINLGELPSVSFIRQKYSYAFLDDILEISLESDAIDSAINNIRIEQARTSLKLNLMELGNNIDKLPPNELKAQISALTENKLLSGKEEDYTNHMVTSENAYADSIYDGEGMTLGLHQIEEYAGKALPSTVVTILAFAGSFKSTYALQLAYLNAMEGKNMLYLSLESTATQLRTKMVLNHIATTTDKSEELINGKWIIDQTLKPELQKVYNNYYNDLMVKLNNRIILWDEEDIQYDTFLDMTEVLRRADKQFKKETGRGLDGVILDQLALLKNTRAGGRKYTYDGAVLNDWMTYFRKQALNFLDTGKEINVFVVSQINRDSYTEASKPKKRGMYDMTAASDSNEIERASATMITLYKDLTADNTLLINIPKARNGYTPDSPIQTEVYGEYSHIGPLKVNLNSFDETTFDLEDLING